MNSLNEIQLLPEQVSNQIAAGEVVQRPSSVVKELVENAVDAGAEMIRVIIKDSGKTLIQVSDDGKGMNEVDAQMCFERHATSKIQRAEDLFEIKTKGFRGEALASIASVAQVELLTKQRGAEMGTRVEIEGGKTLSVEPADAAEGTTFSVRNLFYNIPARRYFLKTDAIEFKHIIDEFERVAITHPEVHFVLTHNGNVVFDLPRSNFKQRVVHVFGSKFQDQLVMLEEDTEIVRVSGYVGRPEVSKKTRGDQYFFVNNRFVKSPFLNHAVQQAYDAILPTGNFPFYVISLDVPPSTIDININPTKTEIKFQDERSVHAILHAAVKRGLGRNQVVPSLDFDSEMIPLTQVNPNDVRIPQVQVNHDFNPFTEESKTWKDRSRNWMEQFNQAGFGFESSAAEQTGLSIPESENENELEPFQLDRTYVIYEQDGLHLVHQQRAHWRILFEQYLGNENGQAIQHFLFPTTLSFGAKEMALLASHKDELNRLGFLFELNEELCEVNAAPTDMVESEISSYFSEYLVLAEMGISREELYEKSVMSMTKRMSIRVGQMLTLPEMRDLIARLGHCREPHVCPQGMPIQRHLERDWINKQFGA